MREVLKAKKLSKRYGDKDQIIALNNIDLTILEGEFVCIMGPSGSGKSTLINLLATLDKPTSGIIEIDGVKTILMNESQQAKFRYENMGFIFQDFNLIDSLTIRENIAVPLVLAGTSKEIVKEKVLQVADKLNVTKYLDKFPGECSGGERQRASSARALVTQPKLIIADEPTGNLDTKNSHALLTLLKELNEKENITIIMVTHDSMIASYSSKLVFIRDGEIETTVERENKSQLEFFHSIVDITSKENQSLFEAIGKEK